MICENSEYKIQKVSYPFPVLKEKLPDIATIEEILKEISKYTEIPIAGLKSKGRERENVEARMIAFYFFKKYIPSLTLKQLGRIFNRDHTTVISAKGTLEDLRDTNKAFISKFEFFERLFNDKYITIDLNNSQDVVDLV